MKKTIIVMGISALLMGTVSCSKKTSYAEEDKLMGDSLALAMGRVMGGQIRTTMDRQRLMDGEQPSLNIEKIIRGMEAVLYADTADDMSYIQGMQIGMTLVQQPIKVLERDGFPCDPALILKGFKEAVNDSLATPETLWQQFSALESRAKSVAGQREIVKNGAAGTAFVDSIKKANSNVMTTESGLSYVVEEQGQGTYATPVDTVLVNYKGYLVDGTVFDDHSTGEPVKFPLTGVVKGFSEGLTLIGEGGKGTLYIPGNLGYGDAGQPRAGIGPNATLVFDVEVVKVLPAQTEE